MPTPLDFARQFYAVEYQLAVLKGMFQQLAGAAPTASPPVPPPPAYKSDPPKPEFPTAGETPSDGAMVLELRDFHIQIGAMQLHWGPSDDAPQAADADAAEQMPPTEAPEPREPAQHFDGRKWGPGPTPTRGIDIPTGEG